ncbi:MAG: hypothetical protein EBZ59_11810, partial [Planctomycetia bacterium]|nr:hypothetical protein [Planctomycetia bacterium]
MAPETLWAAPTLSDVEARSGRNNNLNPIRQLLASLVVVHHCYLLCRAIEKDPMTLHLGFSNLGTTAVWSFFFLSGYLIAKSAASSSPGRFAAARALRIFPGLVVVVVACVFVLGPLESTLGVDEYFRQAETYRYLRLALLQAVPNRLPGVFREGWLSENVNSSLWTLPGEWILYSLILGGFTLVKCIRGQLAGPTGGLTILATAGFAATMLPLP